MVKGDQQEGWGSVLAKGISQEIRSQGDLVREEHRKE